MKRSDEEIKAACERAFQNGGSRVQVFDKNGTPVSQAHVSAAAALRLAFPGEAVYARRKVRGERRYEWKLIGVAP